MTTNYDAYYNVHARSGIDVNEYRRVNREYFRREAANFPIQTDSKGADYLELDFFLEHGWLYPHVISADSSSWGRWEYWEALMSANAQMRGLEFLYQTYAPDHLVEVIKIPTTSIPKIEFELEPYPRVLELIHACLNQIPAHGNWRDGREIEYFNYFCDWILFGLQHHSVPQPPEEPAGCEGASRRLYLTFQIHPFLWWPFDYLGEVLNEIGYFERIHYALDEFLEPDLAAAWVTECGDNEVPELNAQIDSLCLTGRYSLELSNYSLRIYSQVVDTLLAKVTLINFELYAPWAARPLFNFYEDSILDLTFWGQSLTHKYRGKPLDNYPAMNSTVVDWMRSHRYFSNISEHMMGATHCEGDYYCLSFTEFDSDNWLDALPLIKRRYIEDVPQLQVMGFVGETLMDVLGNVDFFNEEQEPIQRRISYQDALDIFMEFDYPAVVLRYGEDDEIALAEAWSIFTDMLCEEGCITPEEYHTWDCPF